jgi:hypothetical protein
MIWVGNPRYLRESHPDHESLAAPPPQHDQLKLSGIVLQQGFLTTVTGGRVWRRGEIGTERLGLAAAVAPRALARLAPIAQWTEQLPPKQ